MLIYSGNTPIMLPINPSPKDNGNMNGKQQFIICMIILMFVGFIIYKLI